MSGVEDVIDTTTEETRTKCTNSENILQSIDQWHISFQTLVNERNKLQDDLQAACQKNHRLKDSNLNLKNDENGNLKYMLKEKDEDLRKFKKEFAEELSKCHQSQREAMREIKVQHSSDINKMKTEISLERKTLQSQIDNRVRDLEEIEARVIQVQQEKEVALSKISMEYENKLARLHRQKTQTASNQGSSSNSDIFRKKLQNMKTEYDHEINRLKNVIATLEDRIAHMTVVHPKMSLLQQKFPPKRTRYN